jgi:hypothetical protein
MLTPSPATPASLVIGYVSHNHKNHHWLTDGAGHPLVFASPRELRARAGDRLRPGDPITPISYWSLISLIIAGEGFRFSAGCAPAWNRQIKAHLPAHLQPLLRLSHREDSLLGLHLPAAVIQTMRDISGGGIPVSLAASLAASPKTYTDMLRLHHAAMGLNLMVNRLYAQLFDSPNSCPARLSV